MRKTALFLIVLGTFGVTLGLLSRFYVYDRVAVIPSDQDSVVVATTSAGRPATYFDIASLREVQAPLTNRTHVVGDPRASDRLSTTSGKPTVVWKTYTCTGPADEDCLDDRLPLAASLDVTAFGAHSSRVVPWSGAYRETQGERDDDPAVRGLVYKLPFDVQKRDYDYWSADLQKPATFRYVGEGEVHGLAVYRFSQEIPATKTGTIDLPGSLVGSDAATVTGDVMFTSRTEMTVEPETGAMVTTTSTPNTYVEVDGRKALTISTGTFDVTDETVRQTAADYRPLALALELVRVWIPWFGVVGGGLLLLAGLWLQRLRRSRTSIAASPEAPSRQTRVPESVS